MKNPNPLDSLTLSYWYRLSESRGSRKKPEESRNLRISLAGVMIVYSFAKHCRRDAE
jgi:hypothetical protein